MSFETGTRIKKIREFRSYTQEHMARKLGLSQTTYSKIENGTTKLDTDRLEQIAKVLDVPVESIVSSNGHIFNVDNSTIDKFYIENMNEENKEALQQTIIILKEQIEYLKIQNDALMKTIEALTKKL